jgi:Tfp pilus assembly protein PilF
MNAWNQADKLWLAGSEAAAAAAYARSDASRPTDLLTYYQVLRLMNVVKGEEGDAPVLVMILAHRMPRLMAELRRIIERDPDWLPPREELAQHLLLLEGDVAAACEQYRMGHRARPDDGQAAAMLGYLLLREGKIEEAERVCEQAAAFREPPASALVNLGVIRLREGRPNEAQVLWKRALATDPENPIAQLNLERTDAQQPAREVDARYLARPLGPKVKAAAKLANDLAAFQREKSDAEKVRLLNEAVQFDPLFVRAHLNLARLYLPAHPTTQDPARALWHARRAAALARAKQDTAELAESLFFVGNALIANGKPEEARKAFEEGKPLAPGAMRGKFDEALTQLGRPSTR